MFARPYKLSCIWLIAVILLAACAQPTATQTILTKIPNQGTAEIVTTTPTPPPVCDAIAWPSLGGMPVPESQDNKYPVERQVMVVGLAPDIDTIISANFVNSLDLLLDQSLGKGVLRVYGLPSTLTSVSVAQTINIAATVPTDIAVYAEPNTPMGASFEGDPWSVGGNPDGAPAPIKGEALDFWAQWAFGGDEGIRPTHANTLTVQGGQGVDVVIFDTSPFSHTYEESALAEPFSFVTYFRDWFSDPKYEYPSDTLIDGMAMCVYDPAKFLSKKPADQPDYASHGLFVSGLVFGTAPDVNLHLVRVLNDQAAGDQGLLIAGLLGLLNTRQTINRPTVVNLSLGIKTISATWTLDDIGIDSTNPTHLKTVADALIIPGTGTIPIATLSGPFLPLALVLTQLRQKGVVIVAAAGNDSTVGVAESATFPAVYSDAIAAQGSTWTGQRSCFSNRLNPNASPPDGWWAPGGDGDSACQHVDLEGNMKAVNCDKVNIGNCPPDVKGPVLISVVLDDEGTPNQYPANGNQIQLPRGFAAWQGTSFATPLMSGWVALQLEAQVTSLGIGPWIRTGPNGFTQITTQ